MSNENTPDLDDDRGELLRRIAARYPQVNLDEHHLKWVERDDTGRSALMVNGATMFDAVGDDLHVVEPVGGGKVVCRVVRPDGSYHDTERPDPYSAEAAKLN